MINDNLFWAKTNFCLGKTLQLKNHTYLCILYSPQHSISSLKSVRVKVIYIETIHVKQQNCRLHEGIVAVGQQHSQESFFSLVFLFIYSKTSSFQILCCLVHFIHQIHFFSLSQKKVTIIYNTYKDWVKTFIKQHLFFIQDCFQIPQPALS